MSRFLDRPFLHLALIGALAMSIGLAACGRKGPLDPPPGASLEGVPQADRPDLMSRNKAAPIDGQVKEGHASVGANGQPLAPPGPKKQIPLDVLLN